MMLYELRLGFGDLLASNAVHHALAATVEANLRQTPKGRSQGDVFRGGFGCGLKVSRSGDVAVISAEGLIHRAPPLFSSLLGGVHCDQLDEVIASAINDPHVVGIVLSVDSAGGSLHGASSLANTLLKLRSRKPIATWSSGEIVGAPYLIAGSAERVFLSSDVVMVGDLGIVISHRDISGAERARGIKTTEVAAGKYKRIASGYEPLSPDGRAYLQDQADSLYRALLEGVAAGRRVSIDTVAERMADGRTFIGRQAISAGLADALGTLDDAILWVRQAASSKQSAIPAERSFGSPASSALPLATHLSSSNGIQEKSMTSTISGPSAPVASNGSSALELKCLREWSASDGPRSRFGNLTDYIEHRKTNASSSVTASSKAGGLGEGDIDAVCAREWESSSAIRAEFGDLGVYRSYRRAEAAGNARIIGRRGR